MISCLGDSNIEANNGMPLLTTDTTARHMEELGRNHYIVISCSKCALLTVNGDHYCSIANGRGYMDMIYTVVRPANPAIDELQIPCILSCINSTDHHGV